MKGGSPFRHYDALVESPLAKRSRRPARRDAPPPASIDPAADMLKRAIRLLAEAKGEAWVSKGLGLAHDQAPRPDL